MCLRNCLSPETWLRNFYWKAFFFSLFSWEFLPSISIQARALSSTSSCSPSFGEKNGKMGSLCPSLNPPSLSLSMLDPRRSQLIPAVRKQWVMRWTRQADRRVSRTLRMGWIPWFSSSLSRAFLLLCCRACSFDHKKRVGEKDSSALEFGDAKRVGCCSLHRLENKSSMIFSLERLKKCPPTFGAFF